jgi:hypothetical protein
MVGAINSKSIWEVWNENKLGYGDRWCSGLLFWYHNCPQPQVCARMWDWMLEPTASLYHTMHALEPVHVQYDYLTNTVSVANDYLEEHKGLTVTAQVYNMESKRLLSLTARTDVPADGVANDILKIDFPEDISPVHFIALQAKDAMGKVVSRNFYWRSTNKYEGKNTVTGPCTAGFEPLGNMAAARPAVKVKTLADKDNMHQWQVSIRNSGSRIAFFCQLLLTDDEGNAVHRTHYSDNFVTLLPGEQETILVRTPITGKTNYRFKFNENMQPSKIIAL